MANAIKPVVTAVASQTFFSIQTDKVYITTDATMKPKSPREKEKRMMKEKQQTMAGPKSPNIKNNKMVVIIAIKAN